jgi:hypothetical protein
MIFAKKMHQKREPKLKKSITVPKLSTQIAFDGVRKWEPKILILGPIYVSLAMILLIRNFFCVEL